MVLDAFFVLDDDLDLYETMDVIADALPEGVALSWAGEDDEDGHFGIAVGPFRA